jgi:drug/metabolite transporter (DMT)-like permease
MAAILHAANYSLVKIVSPTYMGAFGLILCRVIIAGLLFWVVSLVLKLDFRIAKKDWVRLGICALFGTSANILLFFKGLSLTTPTNSSLIMVVTPVLVLLIAVVLGAEKLTLVKVLGLVIALGGVLFLFRDSFNSVDQGRFLGDMLVFVNALFYGIYVVAVKPLTQKYHPMVIFQWLFLIGFVLVLPFSLPELMEVNFMVLPSKVWWSIGFISVLATFLTYTLNVYALKTISPSVVGAYIYLQPLLATGIALLLGQGTLEWSSIAIAPVIVLGVYLVSRKDRALGGV